MRQLHRLEAATPCHWVFLMLLKEAPRAGDALGAALPSTAVCLQAAGRDTPPAAQGLDHPGLCIHCPHLPATALSRRAGQDHFLIILLSTVLCPLFSLSFAIVATIYASRLLQLHLIPLPYP